jgi:hypothetical protein
MAKIKTESVASLRRLRNQKAKDARDVWRKDKRNGANLKNREGPREKGKNPVFLYFVIVNNSANHYSLFNLILNLFLILTVRLTFNVAKSRILDL